MRRPYEGVGDPHMDPVIHGRRECANRFDYWIPALARRGEARLARPE